MMFIELFAPQGSLSDRQRRQITERLIPEVMSAPSAPESVLAAGQALCQVVVHEPETWFVGGQPADPDAGPRYVVRVSVPEEWREGMGAYLISRVTQLLAEVDDDPERLYREPHAWIHVIGVPEGNYGTLGKALHATDLTRMITQSFREGSLDDLPEPPPGMALDPICGMTVPLGDDALTLDHDGTTYAFCSAACRTVFAEDHDIALVQ